MSFFTRYTSDFYRVFSYVIFSFLFLYLLLRAYFVAPLHDEAATLFHFVEPGIIFGKNMLVDANNHLLNSFLCKIIYAIFGDDFFFLRLPNVLAFILYYWGIVKLLKPIKVNYSRALLLLGIMSIPFILEYFANARGYGLSLGFFVCALVSVRKLASTKRVRYVILSYFFLTLAVYSNLTFLVSAILALSLFIIYQYLYYIEIKEKERRYFWYAHGTFLLFLFPAILFARVLKTGGAFYYGSLDGFWQVTGKTLARYVFFYDHDWLKSVAIISSIALMIYMVYKWRKMGTWKFFKRTDTILSWFLFGNAIAILILAKGFEVNYPEDRVGMYLVVLFLLLFGFIFGIRKSTAIVMNLYLFFPLSFLTYINLSTSVFSPDDRMSRSFYEDVIKDVNKSSTVTAYPLMQLTWAYLNRNERYETAIEGTKNFNTAADIILTKTDFLPYFKAFLIDYDTIAYDEQSTFVALVPKIPKAKTPIFKSNFNHSKSTEEFLNIYQSDINDSIRRTPIQIRIKGKVEISKFTRDANIVVSTFDANGQEIRHVYWDERWSHGQDRNFEINFNLAIEKLIPTEKELRVYIWNPQGAEIIIKNGTFEILKIE